MDKLAALGKAFAVVGYYATAARWVDRGNEVQRTGEPGIIRSYLTIAREYERMGQSVQDSLPAYDPHVDSWVAECLAGYSHRLPRAVRLELGQALTEWHDADVQAATDTAVNDLEAWYERDNPDD